MAKEISVRKTDIDDISARLFEGARLSVERLREIVEEPKRVEFNRDGREVWDEANDEYNAKLRKDQIAAGAILIGTQVKTDSERMTQTRHDAAMEKVAELIKKFRPGL